MHQSWGFNVVAGIATLIVGALLGVLAQAAFDRAVESPEQRQLLELKTQLTDNQKQPELEFLLNGKRLFRDSIAIIQTTNSSVPLTLAVHNTGNLSSRELLVSLRYPKAAAHLIPAAAWEQHPAQFIGDADVERQPDLSLITYRTSEMVPPGDALVLPTVVMTDPVKNSPVIGFGLQAASDASKGEQKRLHVVFLLGPERMTIHQMIPGTDLKSLTHYGAQQRLPPESQRERGSI